MAKKKISTANEANDDWLKKIRHGWFKKQERRIYKKMKKNDRPNQD